MRHACVRAKGRAGQGRRAAHPFRPPDRSVRAYSLASPMQKVHRSHVMLSTSSGSIHGCSSAGALPSSQSARGQPGRSASAGSRRCCCCGGGDGGSCSCRSSCLCRCRCRCRCRCSRTCCLCHTWCSAASASICATRCTRRAWMEGGCGTCIRRQMQAPASTPSSTPLSPQSQPHASPPASLSLPTLRRRTSSRTRGGWRSGRCSSSWISASLAVRRKWRAALGRHRGTGSG